MADDLDRTLLNAVKKGDDARVVSLLVEGANPNQIFSSETDGWAMCSAVEADDDEIINLLLRSGGDPNLLNAEASQSRSTPLLCSMLASNYDAFRALLDAGANPEAPLCEKCADQIPFTHLTKAFFYGEYRMAYDIYKLVGMSAFDEKAIVHALENFSVLQSSDENMWREKFIEILNLRGVQFEPR